MKHQVKTVALAICDKCHSEVTELVLNSNTCESCYTSKRLTVKKVNAVLNQFGYEIVANRQVKNPYYYFWTVKDDSPLLYYSSIDSSYRLNDFTITELVNLLLEKIQDTARESYSALITIRCANIEQKIKEWLTLDK